MKPFKESITGRVLEWSAYLIGLLFFGGLILFLTGISVGAIVYNTTRAGQHKGYVTAVEQDGILFHNYKVYFKTDNSSSQEDTYCVQRGDDVLASKLREVNQAKALITIKYEGVRGIGLGLCTQDRITGVIE